MSIPKMGKMRLRKRAVRSMMKLRRQGLVMVGKGRGWGVIGGVIRACGGVGGVRWRVRGVGLREKERASEGAREIERERKKARVFESSAVLDPCFDFFAWKSFSGGVGTGKAVPATILPQEHARLGEHDGE